MNREKSLYFLTTNFLPALLLLVFISNASFAQQKEKDSTQSLQLLKYDVLSGLGGVKTAFTRPLSWETEDYILAGSVVAGTAALYLIDEEAAEFLQGHKRNVPGVIQEIGRYGSPESFYVLNGGIYLYGLFSRNEQIRKTGVLLVASSTASGIMLAIGKTVIGRARPTTGEGKQSFRFFSTDREYNSFPSGHSLFAFTTAYAIGKQFDNPYVKAGIYGLGLVWPVSRLWEGEHWLTDVTLSIALGVAVVESIDNFLNTRRDYNENKVNGTGITWNFHLGPGQMGLTGRF